MPKYPISAAERSRLNKALLKAVKSNSAAAIDMAVAAGGDLAMRTDPLFFAGETLLGYAIHHGKGEAFRHLLALGVDVNGRDPEGRTALMIAARQLYADMVVQLIEHGADASLRDKQGLNAMMYAFHGADAKYDNRATQDHLVDIRARALRCYRALTLAEAQGARPAPARESLPAPVTDITLQRALGDRIMQETFDFAAHERITLVRKGEQGPVEALLREDFSAISDATLHNAFNAYAARGGTLTQEQVFGALHRKPALKR